MGANGDRMRRGVVEDDLVGDVEDGLPLVINRGEGEEGAASRRWGLAMFVHGESRCAERKRAGLDMCGPNDGQHRERGPECAHNVRLRPPRILGRPALSGERLDGPLMFKPPVTSSLKSFPHPPVPLRTPGPWAMRVCASP